MTDRFTPGLVHGSMIQNAAEPTVVRKEPRNEATELMVALAAMVPPMVDGLPPRQIIEEAKAALAPVVGNGGKNLVHNAAKNIQALQNFVGYGRDYNLDKVSYANLYQQAKERMGQSKDAIAELTKLETEQAALRLHMEARLKFLKKNQEPTIEALTTSVAGGKKQEGWAFHWNSDGSPDFFIPADDARVRVLLRYAETLGKKIPKGGAVPPDMIEKLPGNAAQFVHTLGSSEEKREAAIAILLNQAMTRGITLEDGTHTDGFGVYNPKVAEAIAKQGHARKELAAATTELKNVKEYLYAWSHQREPSLAGLPPAEVIENAKYALLPVIGSSAGGSVSMAESKRKALEEFVSYGVNPAVKALSYSELYNAAKVQMQSYQPSLEKLNAFKKERADKEIDLQQRVASLEKRMAEKFQLELHATKELNAVNPPEDMVAWSQHRMSNLGNFGNNETVCRHRGALAILLMKQAGVDTMAVGGTLTSETAFVDAHLWAVSQSTGNLVEFSGSPEATYAINTRKLKKEDIIAGHTAIYQNINGNISAYGTGFSPELLAQVKERSALPTRNFGAPMLNLARYTKTKIYGANEASIGEYDEALIQAMQAYKLSHTKDANPLQMQGTTNDKVDADKSLSTTERVKKAMAKYQDWCDSSPVNTCWLPPKNRTDNIGTTRHP